MTSTLPGLGAISVPASTVVLEDSSVGGTYAARVGVSGSEIPVLSKREDLIRIASSLTGVLPQRFNVAFDDFTLLTSGAATWGGGGGGTTGGPASCLHMADGNLYITPLMPDLTVTSQKWMWEIRFKQYTTTTGFALGLTRFADATHGYETFGVHMVNAGGWKFVFGHQYQGVGYNIWQQSPPSAAYYDVLQTEDITWHTLRVWSAGDGSYSYSWDGAAAVTYTMANGGHAGPIYIRLYGARVDIDYVFFAYGS